MVKEIIFGGYSAQPSDYLSPDGDLSTAVNLIPEDGSLKTILPSATKLTLPAGYKVLFVHKGIGYEHYIVANHVVIDYQSGDGEVHGYHEEYYLIYWMDSNAGFLEVSSRYFGRFDTLSHINAVGNTLIIFDDNGMNYYLWQMGAYNSLGNQIPFPEISFGLVGGVESYAEYNTSSTAEDHDELESWYVDEYRECGFKITSDITASRETQDNLNNFLAGKITKHQNKIKKDGGFTLPFFVRYALRLYNGDLILHSAPVLLTPSTFGSLCYVAKGSYHNTTWERWFDILTPFGYLAMLVLNSEDYLTNSQNVIYQLLNKWGDIVKSVDVFVSSPIYTYDINSDFKEITYENADKYECMCGSSDRGIVNGQYVRHYNVFTVPTTIKLREQTQGSVAPSDFWIPEVYSDERIKDNIMASSRFYLIKSVPIDSLKEYVSKVEKTISVSGTNYTYSYLKELSIDSDSLLNLETKELMSDDSLTHDKLMPKQSYCYNNRLNISNIYRELYKGFNPNCLLQYIEVDSGTTIESNLQTHIKAEVFIKENNEIYIVDAGNTYNKIAHFISSTNLSRFGFVFYPNPNAIAMRITEYDSNTSIIFPLVQHDYLNGACAIFPFWNTRNQSTTTAPSVSQNVNIVSEPSLIKTSEVNNPFYFPSVGSNTVGTGDVIAMCAAVKALSQGQFGQFPMYAFTSEGVWAMQINSTGGFTAIQPVTRDVCINADSITQLDNAVLFAADRGIMLLSGSDTTCISDNLDAEQQFNPIESLPGCEKVATMASLTSSDITIIPFKEFVKNCRMIYDYTNQRIIVYNTALDDNKQKLCKYAYVYSLKTKKWGMMNTTICDNINSYPEALAVDGDNNILDLSQPTGSAYGLVVTRPLKFDGDILKTINTLIVRGMFKTGNVKTALYSSNDLYDWYLVSSSVNHRIKNISGTGYKYFRLVLLTSLSAGESVVGCTIEYKRRMTNHIR